MTPLEYEATLGALHVTGQQRLEARSGEYDPVLFLPTNVGVGAVMVHGAQDTRYAEMSFVWNGRPLELEPSTEDRGTWLLAAEETRVVARSLITGPMSPEFRSPSREAMMVRARPEKKRARDELSVVRCVG